MSIYKVNANAPRLDQIEQLNDMIIELNGKIAQAQFDKREIVDLYSQTSKTAIYLRDQTLGHTLATYTGWSHIHADTGYSIWKYTPTTYAYSAYNQLYCDNKLYENRGQANSETATAFNKVFLYNGDSGVGYIDNTTEAGTEGGTYFELMDSTTDYLYCGLSSTFSGVSFEFETRGSNYTLHIEYYNGNWVELDISGTTYGDDTSDFKSNGRIYWTIPGDWNQVAVNGSTYYWVRISTTTDPVTTARAYMVYPANSVVSLLELSSSEVLNEDWAWCTYGSSVYVTIKNAGTSAYEGNSFITSASTAINKQNYFISNHEFKADYLKA